MCYNRAKGNVASFLLYSAEIHLFTSAEKEHVDSSSLAAGKRFPLKRYSCFEDLWKNNCYVWRHDDMSRHDDILGCGDIAGHDDMMTFHHLTTCHGMTRCHNMSTCLDVIICGGVMTCHGAMTY